MMLRPLSFAAAIVAISAIGCSDAPARPAKLGLTMKLENPAASLAAGRSCTDQNTWDIGKAVKSGDMVIDVEAPTPTDSGTTLENGKSGANISCTVRKSGSFNSNGGGTDPQRDQPNGIINFTMGGTAKNASTNVAVSVYTPGTLSIQTNPGFPSCTMTTVHELKLGALWATFDCPIITDVGRPSVGCHASGTIVLEYCKTGEEED
jgi:hypothetical protein